MKNLNQKAIVALHHIQRSFRRYKEPIYAGLVAMLILFIVTASVAPSNEQVYKSDITAALMENRELQKNIDKWDEKTLEAKKKIAVNNKIVFLLSQVTDAKK